MTIVINLFIESITKKVTPVTLSVAILPSMFILNKRVGTHKSYQNP